MSNYHAIFVSRNVIGFSASLKPVRPRNMVILCKILEHPFCENIPADYI